MGRVCEANYLLPVDEVLNKLANVVGPAVLKVNVVCSSTHILQNLKLQYSTETLKRIEIRTATSSINSGRGMFAAMQMIPLIDCGMLTFEKPYMHAPIRPW